MKRVAILGAGVMGRNHARVVSQSLHSTLATVIDPDPLNGKALSEKYQCDWRSSISEYRDIDYVIIASPTEFHFDSAQRALDQGIPILIEKPISANLDETKTLLDLSEQRNVLMMCGLVERFNPVVLTVSEMIDKVIGIYSVRHSPTISRISTDVDGDLLIHDLDICMRLMNSIPESMVSTNYMRKTKHGSLIDAMDVLATFPGDRFANMSVSRLSHKKIRTLNIVEEERLIEVDLLRRDITIYRNVSEGSLRNGAGYKQQTIMEIPTLITNTEPLVSQLDHFVSLMDEQNFASFAAERRSLFALHQTLNRLKQI
jgi:predicted dehydrogenase